MHLRAFRARSVSIAHCKGGFGVAMAVQLVHHIWVEQHARLEGCIGIAMVYVVFVGLQ